MQVSGCETTLQTLGFVKPLITNPRVYTFAIYNLTLLNRLLKCCHYSAHKLCVRCSGNTCVCLRCNANFTSLLKNCHNRHYAFVNFFVIAKTSTFAKNGKKVPKCRVLRIISLPLNSRKRRTKSSPKKCCQRSQKHATNKLTIRLLLGRNKKETRHSLNRLLSFILMKNQKPCHQPVCGPFIPC